MHSMLQNFKEIVCLTLTGDVLISTLISTAETFTKYCKTMFLALPRLSYITFNRPVVGKITLLYQKSQQTHYYYRIAAKLVKAYQYLLL